MRVRIHVRVHISNFERRRDHRIPADPRLIHVALPPVNKQLNDKERVAAALENSHLLGVVENCLATSGQRGKTAQPVMQL